MRINTLADPYLGRYTILSLNEQAFDCELLLRILRMLRENSQLTL